MPAAAQPTGFRTIRTHLRSLAAASLLAVAGLGLPGAIGSALAEAKSESGCTAELCGSMRCTSDGKQWHGAGETISVKQPDGKWKFYMCDGRTGHWVEVGRFAAAQTVRVNQSAIAGATAR